MVESADVPVSIFMAGSPGAGKTEVSKQLVKQFHNKPVRIDADEIRPLCPGYNGLNAHLFQKAATRGVHLLYDFALHANLNVILNGTFAYAGALTNIQRSVDRGRIVRVVFVYQNPFTAWRFTKKREALEGRRVSREVFIDAFLSSQNQVNEAKAQFGDRIRLSVLVKNYETGLGRFELNVDKIDPFLGESYTRSQLEDQIL